MKRVVKFLLFTTLTLVSAGGCFSGNSPNLTSDPVITLDPNGSTPLAAQLTLSTDIVSTVEVEVDDGTQTWTLSFNSPGRDHTLTLLGFKPDRDYLLEVTIMDAAGRSGKRISPVLELNTEPLPVPFPVIQASTILSARAESGYTLFPTGMTGNYIIILDDTGEVVWYYRAGSVAVYDIRQLKNGNLLFTMGGSQNGIAEMDMLGNYINTYKSAAPGEGSEGGVPVDDTGLGFHHESFPTSLGTYLTLGFEVSTVEHFHTSDSDPALFGTVEVTDDTIIEFDPDGTVLNRWSLLDILDRERIGYDSFNVRFPMGTENDWAHANAVIYDERDDSIIVSARHQDAVFKILRQTGELVWILGNHENWGADFQDYLLIPTGGDFQWPYHQHAPMITPSGGLLLFDNGNYRASPYDGTVPLEPEESYSRAVEYLVDEENMTVEQIWEYGSSIDPVLFSFALSDADHLRSTGNVLITFGGLRGVGTQSSADMGRGALQARMIEVDRNAADEVVYDVSVYGLLENAPQGWTVYRSERIANLYPENL